MLRLTTEAPAERAAALSVSIVPDTAVRRFWQSVHGGFAHTDYTHRQHRGEASVVKRWRGQWLDDWLADRGNGWLRGRRLGDFGIGGGLLGELMCREHGISHYVGFDVADRQLELTRQRLRHANCSHSLVLVDGSRGDATDFRPYRLDALISQQVLQHFPSEAYTLSWLRMVSAARIGRLLLEVRYADDPKRPVRDEVRFNNWGQRSQALYLEVAHATVLQCEYLHARLPGYRLAWHSANRSQRFRACAFELATSRAGRGRAHTVRHLRRERK